MRKRRKFTQRPYPVTAYQKAALSYLTPPEDITVSQWAEEHRILGIRSAAMPGHWRNSITPYLVEIMDTLNDFEVVETIFVKPSQIGGTEALLNRLAYTIAQDPGPALLVYPTDELGDSVGENRIVPMIEDCPELAKHYNERESSKKELQFDNMYVSISGANSPASLASKPIRYLFLDEVDKYPPATRKEADPISLARERTKTFVNRKIYMCSTPTLRTGHIWKAKESADIEKHYFVPCPHCGAYIELNFQSLKWPGEDAGLDPADRAELAAYVCQECGCIISDAEKNRALALGEWRAVRQQGKVARRVAYWINTLYSPFVRFSEIAKEFLISKDDPDLLHNFANSWLAEPWEDTKLKTSAELVLERQTDLPENILPSWTKLVTGGVDVQENCLYWTIRAWGDFLTSQNIAHGQAFSFGEIEQVMNLEYRKEDGTPFMVDLCLIDSGDQTDEVYDFCAINSDWALPCKGTSSQLSHYRLSTVNKTGSRAYGMNLVLVDGGRYKDMIAGRLRKPNGKGSWMVYQGCDEEYAKQVTAEHKVAVRNSKGQESLVWVPKSGNDGADNHYLDCEVYCMAAADVKGVRQLFLREDPPPKAAKQPDPTPEESWIRANDNWV